MWKVLFTCAYFSRVKDMPKLRRLLFELVPRLIPCKQCRRHFLEHLPEVNKKVKDVNLPEKAFLWLYYLKDAVNHTPDVSCPSPPIKYVLAKYDLHEGVLFNDWMLADLWVLIAVEANDNQRHQEFLEMSLLVSSFLPDHVGLCLRAGLEALSGEGTNVVTNTMKMAGEVRRSCGLSAKALKTYKESGNV